MKSMALKVTSCLILATIGAVPVFARQDTLTDREYRELLVKVEKADPSVDFGRLRDLISRHNSYSPYGSGEGRKEMFEAFNRGNQKKALEIALKNLKASPLDVDAHFVSMVASDRLGKSTLSAWHRYVFKGIIDSIIRSGDGKSQATAYKVISVSEEYAVLRVLGLKFKSQALDHVGEHAFDVMTVVDPDTKTEHRIYFNIDPIWKAEMKTFQKGKE